MRWAEPTAEFAVTIAENLRQADVTEVALSDRLTAYEAVRTSWANADLCMGIETDDGVPCGLTGLNGDRIWLLGTEDLTATRRRRLQLCREGRHWVERCAQRAGCRIGNDVYAKNTESIKWLKALGFTVEQPRPIGMSGALFSNFWREP